MLIILIKIYIHKLKLCNKSNININKSQQNKNITKSINKLICLISIQ